MKSAKRLFCLGAVALTGHFCFAGTLARSSSAEIKAAVGSNTSIGTSATSQDRVLIKALSSDTSGTASDTPTVALTFPSGIDTATLKIVLNGKDVTRRFESTSCAGAYCETATLSTVDGIVAGKNVLYAVARKSDRSLVSSRLRFDNDTKPIAEARSLTANLSSPGSSTPPLPTNSTFLPPSVALTLSPGGWQSGKPWVTVGTQQSYPDASYSCSGVYTAMVLDRKTLLEKTAAPESSPQCLANGAAVSSYIKSLSSGDLVILGTNSGQQTDADNGNGYFDTSAIGGTQYNCPSGGGCKEPSQTVETPLSYLIIGAGGAAPGSAYENYDTKPAYEAFNSFATGTLQEDANGNYNYQSSTPVEYMVVPNDPSNNNQSTITLTGTASLSRYSGYNWPNRLVFYSPSSTSNGFWLLYLRRDDLDFVAGQSGNYQNCFSAGNTAKQQTDMTSCGQFFPTGSADAETAGNAFLGLAVALNNTSFNDLVFLVSVGNAVNPNYTAPSGLAYDSVVGGPARGFGAALEPLGGTPGQILSLYQPGSAYTLISCYNCGNSLNSHAVLSTTVNNQQGQTGVPHGLLARNSNGLYWSAEASQESVTQMANGQSADFTLTKVGSQQPVEWPELSGTLLPNATSVAGQGAAYQYLSYQLVTQHYIIGAQGNYLDDIHFYFTGSNNTYLDYHDFNPVNLPYPDPSSSCYSWNDPVTSTTLPCFTPNDFSAVATQLSTEIVDLDNVLQFMVNGSTNMKDIVASSNGSAALALIGAGAAVQGSSLQPAPAAPVQVSSSGILSLFSGVVNLGLQAASDGLVSEDDLKEISQVGTTISDMFDLSSSVAGGYTTGGATALPNPEYEESIGIANLASSGLQQQITAGFDTELDNILGDWGKLSAIGPLITNSNDQAFYSPNQAVQNATVVAFGQAAQRSFYISLLPLSYSVQYYPSWDSYPTENPPNPPNMGDVHGNDNECTSWYPWNQTTVWPLISTYHPTFYGSSNPWTKYIPDNQTPIDYYILASQTITNAGKSNQSILFLDGQVGTSLFSASGLNMPLDPFVMPHGPMAAVFWDATVKGFDNFPADQTCAAGVPQGEQIAGAPSDPDATTTVLTAPASAVLGDAVNLQATVTSAAGIPTGTVYFQIGNTVLGTSSLDPTGTAQISTKALALGPNSIAAYYQVNAPFYASQSDSASVEVYANAPSMTLALSNMSVSFTYGTKSSPVTLQVTSTYGLSGTLTFSCTGLPVGISCNFTPANANIAAGGNASTSFTVSGSALQTAGLFYPRLAGILGFGCSMLCLWRARKGSRTLFRIACHVLLTAVSFGYIAGCGGSSHDPSSIQETGSKTILINVASGTRTQTIPLVLNIQ
jgi:hypothetical protein